MEAAAEVAAGVEAAAEAVEAAGVEAADDASARSRAGDTGEIWEDTGEI